MSRALRVLIVGESWVTPRQSIVGLDQLPIGASAVSSPRHLVTALSEAGMQVTHLPGERANTEFPETQDGLGAWDVVVLSDVGSNTLLLHPGMYLDARPRPNRLSLLRDWVAAGGGLLMCGGYLSFSGFAGRARYGATALAECLPVIMRDVDDRVEAPEGIAPQIASPHPITAGLAETWPVVLGYNQVTTKPNALLVATVGPDPLVVAGHHGTGRVVAFTSDCEPHWCSADFVEWSGYATLFTNIVGWAAGSPVGPEEKG